MRAQNYFLYFVIAIFFIVISTLAQANSFPTRSSLFKNTNHHQPSNKDLYDVVPVPTQVKVTVGPAGWVQTINICNNGTDPIPLKNISFSFNWTGNLTSIWGQPWLAWQVQNHQGNQYLLSGGTEWASDLQPDPNCTHPIIIQFNSNPSTQAPAAPFEFKSEGAKPVGNGTLNILVATAPTTGLINPSIKITGMGITREQVVPWGQNWQLTNLVPGNYTISGTNVDNGTLYYKFYSLNVTVIDKVITPVNIQYVSVPTKKITVSVLNTSNPIQTIFTGKNYNFTNSLQNGSTITLPTDSYTVSASVPGYSVTATPNPLIIPTHSSLTITLEKNNLTPTFGAYYQTWSSKWVNDPAKADLANLPNYVTNVYLAFAKPDAAYTKGSYDYRSLGLEFNYDSGKFLKDVISNLHSRNPNTKVILSIGGAAYTNWANFNPKAIADFVTDFGLDGVDLDYEASNPGCMLGSDNLIHCQIDTAYQGIVQGMRSMLPRPYLISATTWSIAAYGQDKWINSGPKGDYTGMILPFFRSAAAKDIDFVNVMSYDASNAYNPIEALAAYSNYFSGPIYMGVEVPPEAWGGHVYTLTEVHDLTHAVTTSANQRLTPAGMMMWSLQKVPNGTPSSTNPNAQMIATTICQDLGLPNCNSPLFP